MRKKKEYPNEWLDKTLKELDKATSNLKKASKFRQSTKFEKFIGRFIGYSLLIVFLLFLIWLIKLLLIAIF